MPDAEEFFRQYAERSGVTVEQLREWGQEVFPCDCDWEKCQGWQIVNKECTRTTYELLEVKMPDAARKWLEENEKLAKMAPFQIVPPIETVRRLLAECERLKEELDEGNEYYRRVVDSECAPDEIHCTCVPALRYKIDTLEAQKLALVELVRRMRLRFDLVGEEMEYFPEEWQALGAELQKELENDD